MPPLASQVDIILHRLPSKLNRLVVPPRHGILIHLDAVLHQRENHAPTPGNLPHRSNVHVVVLARVDLRADALLHAVDARRLGSSIALNVLADPDVPIHAQQDVNLAAPVGRLHGPQLALRTHNAGTATGARHGDEDAVAQLSVLETAGVQAGGAVLVQLLDLGDEQVALGEEAPDLELVGLGALAEDAAGEVDGGDLEDGELGGGDIDAPALGLDLDDAADDEVANLRVVARAEGPHGKELVCAGEGAC